MDDWLHREVELLSWVDQEIVVFLRKRSPGVMLS